MEPSETDKLIRTMQLVQSAQLTPKAWANYKARLVNNGNIADAAKDGEILIYGPIVNESDASWYRDLFGDESFVSDAQVMSALNKASGDITIRINSPGGDAFVASSIVQAIREYSDTITAQVDGVAASSASLIMAACDSATIADLGQVMIHRAWTVVMGNADDIRSRLKMLDNADAAMVDLYSAKMKETSEADIEAMLAAETWFSAKEAVEIGLCDSMTATPDADEPSTDAVASAFQQTLQMAQAIMEA